MGPLKYLLIEALRFLKHNTADNVVKPVEIENELTTLMHQAWALWGRRCGKAPPVKLDLKGRSAGQVRQGVIRLNKPLLDDHPEQWRPTLIHELAHVIARRLFPRSRPHGPKWRAVNRELGGADEIRHGMDTRRHRARRTRYFEYLTAAGQRVWLSSIRHRRAQSQIHISGTSGYLVRCTRDVILSWTGLTELR